MGHCLIHEVTPFTIFFNMSDEFFKEVAKHCWTRDSKCRGWILFLIGEFKFLNLYVGETLEGVPILTVGMVIVCFVFDWILMAFCFQVFVDLFFQFESVTDFRVEATGVETKCLFGNQ